MDCEQRMADHASAVFDAQMGALLAEREAVDEWAWRLDAAKREAALRFDAETRLLLLEREALDIRARQLVDKDAMRIVDSMVREAAFLPRPHVDNGDDQAVLVQNVGTLKQKDNKRKASYLEPASGKENPFVIMISDDDQPAAKMEKPPQGDNISPGSEVSKWWCGVCKLECQGAKAMASHVSSKRHKRMVKTSREESPSSVKKNLPEMNSSKPTSGIREPSGKEKKKASVLTVAESWCALCQVNCSTSKGLLVHQAGRKHLRKRVVFESERRKQISQQFFGERVNAGERPFVKGSWMWNPNITAISLSECNNKCMYNESETATCVPLDLESLSATVSAPLFDGTNQPTS